MVVHVEVALHRDLSLRRQHGLFVTLLAVFGCFIVHLMEAVCTRACEHTKNQGAAE